MKKIFTFVILTALFLNSCSSVPSVHNTAAPAIKLQEYDYTKLNLKDLLEKIKQFNAKIQKKDLSRGLDEATMNELYEIDRQYKAFKALEFNKQTAEFALKPKSKTTFRFNTYCLNSGKASPHDKEQFTLQKESPDVPLYQEIATYTNSAVKADRTFKQSLLWNLQNEVPFEKLPADQQVFLMKMDPKSLLKINNYFKQEAKKQLTDFAKSQIPYYKQTSDAVDFVKGQVYTYQDYEKRVRSIVSKYKLSDVSGPIQANGYPISTIVAANGYSSSAVTFINTSDVIIYISCASYFKPSRKDVQPLGFDLPLIFFDIAVYGADIDKEYEKLNKYIEARNQDIQNAGIKPYCNLYIYRELAARYGIMLPMTDKGWTMTANQMYDYFSSGMIPRTANGALDHAAAQRLAADGNIVLAIYKDPSGKPGHAVFVKDSILEKGRVMTDGYNTAKGEVTADGTFGSQFGQDKWANTDFFVIR